MAHSKNGDFFFWGFGLFWGVCLFHWNLFPGIVAAIAIGLSASQLFITAIPEFLPHSMQRGTLHKSIDVTGVMFIIAVMGYLISKG